MAIGFGKKQNNMNNNLNETIEKLTEFFKTEIKTETIMGQQFKLGEFTCVPVMSIGLGFAGGSGEGKMAAKDNSEGAGVGGGAGIGMGPVGFLVTKGEEIQFIPTRSSKGLSAAFEKVPGFLEKLFDKSKKQEAEKA